MEWSGVEQMIHNDTYVITNENLKIDFQFIQRYAGNYMRLILVVQTINEFICKQNLGGL